MNLFNIINNTFLAEAKCQRLAKRAATLTLLALTFPAVAANMHAHSHGVAQLTIAMEGDELAVTIVSPAASIVGFEHKARTDSEKAALDNAKELLEQPNAVLTFTGSDCELHATAIDLTSILPETSGSLTQREGHSHEIHQRENHSEISAHYDYRCQSNHFPRSLELRIFSAFDGIEKIDTMWIHPTTQGGATLTPKDNKVEFVQ
ncbi:DUF2796 domain-containing protein [Gilvimarinus agarilyticus]|uniref:DUF2796 domain-containing protein n=1 Tax=Gilvimarinus agarilyticus TaxID=679259 RepID=UPI0005A02276|nr:DUF2796 domain-containing protein [Gilvimarinus agarilyticus]